MSRSFERMLKSVFLFFFLRDVCDIWNTEWFCWFAGESNIFQKILQGLETDAWSEQGDEPGLSGKSPDVLTSSERCVSSWESAKLQKNWTRCYTSDCSLSYNETYINANTVTESLGFNWKTWLWIVDLWPAINTVSVWNRASVKTNKRWQVWLNYSVLDRN